MTKVRFVVMVPTVIEEEYDGKPENLTDWARVYATNHFCEAVPTGHKSGPTDGRYWPKLMECCVIDKDNGMKIVLDEMIAPGGCA